MRYINNTYYIDKVSAEKISKKFNTPSYVYSYNKILESISKVLLFSITP